MAHFDRVFATDVSSGQLQHARPHSRIDYRLASAENSGLTPGSVDLVVAATAMHWFNLPRFYEEVQRVIRAGGVLAAWTYHAAHAGPPLDGVLGPFYRDVVGPYFASGARMVDARYEGISLPGVPLSCPSSTMSARWSADDALSFVRTWSGVQTFMARTGRDPVEAIEAEVRAAFGGTNERRTISWPIYIRAARF